MIIICDPSNHSYFCFACSSAQKHCSPTNIYNFLTNANFIFIINRAFSCKM